MFEIKPVPADKALTWTVKVDGKEISPRLLEINSDYGNFKLGWRPEGYHGWAFKPGKGGAMTLPYSRTPQGDLIVALVHEHRPNMGARKVYCPLGGFVEVGEAADVAAARESMEEGGIDTKGATKLPGVDMNTDRMYYIMEEDDTWGMQAYGLQVPFERLEPAGDDLWRPAAGLISHKKESDLYFMPWRTAIVRSADTLALAGIARLLSEVL